MSIITISRGSYSRGKEIAEKVARKIGYECISRDIILEASDEFNVPEMKLVRAIHNAPSILDRLSYRKERYIAFIRTALLQHFKKDNIVYHGLASHFFVQHISHVLKVRIIADMEERVKLEMNREGISIDKAKQILKKDDQERRKWSHNLYGIDTWNPRLYDLVIHIRKIRVDAAVDIICHTIKLKNFQTTTQSQNAMNDLALSAEVEAALIKENLKAKVSAENGIILVKIKAPIPQEMTLVKKIEGIAKDIEGVKEIRTNVVPDESYAG